MAYLRIETKLFITIQLINVVTLKEGTFVRFVVDKTHAGDFNINSYLCEINLKT